MFGVNTSNKSPSLYLTKNIHRYTLLGSAHLTLFNLMDYPIHIDTISMDLSNLYCMGSAVQFYILFLKIVFYFRKQCSP